MNPNRKQDAEVRFELLTWGAILIIGALLFLAFRNSTLFPIIFFVPGLILLASAVYQDLQDDWTTGWPTYLGAMLLVATGFAGVVTATSTGASFTIIWLVVIVIEIGLVLIIKALFDPSPDITIMPTSRSDPSDERLTRGDDN
ncbi:MAG: hypothetical protein GYB68_01640 [Chloroflexi bacterium]|nr:hypothetical protein [Chloroflexota bacterium]